MGWLWVLICCAVHADSWELRTIPTAISGSTQPASLNVAFKDFKVRPGFSGIRVNGKSVPVLEETQSFFHRSQEDRLEIQLLGNPKPLKVNLPRVTEFQSWPSKTQIKVAHTQRVKINGKWMNPKNQTLFWKHSDQKPSNLELVGPSGLVRLYRLQRKEKRTEETPPVRNNYRLNLEPLPSLISGTKTPGILALGSKILLREKRILRLLINGMDLKENRIYFPALGSQLDLEYNRKTLAIRLPKVLDWKFVGENEVKLTLSEGVSKVTLDGKSIPPNQVPLPEVGRVHVLYLEDKNGWSKTYNISKTTSNTYFKTADDLRNQIYLARALKKPQRGLSVKTGPYSVRIKKKKGYIVVKGNFARPKWNILWQSGNQEGSLNPGPFSIKLPTIDSRFTLRFVAFNSKGDEARSQYLLYSKQKPSRYGHKKGIGAKIGLGLTHLSYEESPSTDLSQPYLSPELSFFYFFGPKFDMELSARSQLVPLLGDEGFGDSLFLNLDSRLGYQLPLLKYPWKLSVMLGLYYLTTNVSLDRFGYKNLMGPQLYPVLRRDFSQMRQLKVFVRFSPLGEGLELQSLGNHWMGLGTEFLWGRESGQAYHLGVDFSRLRFTSGGKTATQNVFSLKLGYSI